MNIGDMVTLSAAALNRDTLYAWSKAAQQHHYGKPKPMGVVVEVKSHARIGFNSRYQPVYVVKWITSDAPKGREHQHGYYAKQHADEFYRVDLKFVSKRKRSKK